MVQFLGIHFTLLSNEANTPGTITGSRQKQKNINSQNVNSIGLESSSNWSLIDFNVYVNLICWCLVTRVLFVNWLCYRMY